MNKTTGIFLVAAAMVAMSMNLPALSAEKAIHPLDSSLIVETRQGKVKDMADYMEQSNDPAR
jgi:hypothetical protein